MKAFVRGWLGTVALMLQLSISGAQRERSLTLTSSVSFDVSPLPYLCPGSTVQFTCMAVDFTGIDWDRNGDQFQQYTGTSDVNETVVNPNSMSGLSVILNGLNLASVTSIDFNSTVRAIVNEGISSGDVITCGNRLFNTTDLVVNYTAIPSPPVPLNNFLIESSNVNNSVRLTINFDTTFSVDNRVEKYCIRSQNSACPNDSCVPTTSNYTCHGLEAGGEYNFTIRAVNCVNQESEETAVITITPQTPSRLTSCEAFAVYNQSTGALSRITTLWTKVEDPPNITSSISQNVLFYNISYISTNRISSVRRPLSNQLCGADNNCNHSYSIRDESLTSSGSNYSVRVVAGNIVGTGEPRTCDGQINNRNLVFDVSTTAPSFMDDSTTILCRFSNPPSSPNTTRQCQFCYSTLVSSQTLSECITQSTTEDDDSLVTFRIQLPSSSGGSYGPFFYQVTAIEDSVTLATVQGQQYTGCSPLLLGSVSSPEVNSRCSSLSGGTQQVEGIQGDNNIIFCYNSEGTLQGAVAMAYCDDGYERVGEDRVTCGPNGSWGELPRCSKDGQVSTAPLLGWQIALIVIGVLMWVAAACLGVLGVVVLVFLAREKFNASFRFWHCLYIFLLVLTALLLVISAALWITLGATVSQYSNGGQVDDDTFSTTRANLCITAFLLSLLAALSVIIALIFTKLMPKVLASKGSVDITLSDDVVPEKSNEELSRNGGSAPPPQEEETTLESERKEDLAPNQVVDNGELAPDSATQEEEPTGEHEREEKMDDSTLALLSEGEKPEPEDEEIRDLLNELQIQPLSENIATSVPKLENQEEKRDEVTETGQLVDNDML